MNVLVTGASGFLGSRLAASWTARGHRVIETASSRVAGQPAGTLRFRLGDPFDAQPLQGVEVILHGAHVFGERTFTANVQGTQALFHAGRAAGARRQIFISSASALPDAASEYGRIKFALERFFIDEGETVVRPGLVLGAGGMFGRIMDKVLRYPVVPLLDGGRDRVPIVGIGDFLAAMTTILESDLSGVFNLYAADLVPMRRLLGDLARLSGRRRRFIAVPANLAESLLAGIERLGIPFPVGAGSLRALKQSRGTVLPKSDLLRLIGSESPLDYVLAAALDEQARLAARA